jgi:exosortase E/protease (VPEID-CTERM system)
MPHEASTIVPASDGCPTDAQARPWFALAVSLAMLAVQVILLDRVVGEQMLGITDSLLGRRFLRKEIFVAVLAAFGVLQANVRREWSTFRLARLSPGRLAVQAAVFATLFGFLAAMACGLPQREFGEMPTALVAAGLVIAWLASLAMLLPSQIRVAPIVGGSTFAAAVVAAGCFLADRGTDWFWARSRGLTTQCVAWLITPFAGAPVVHPEPHVIGTEAFKVAILSPCSGWHGILLITSLFAGYLWWFRRLHRFPHALLLFPIGIVLIYVANLVRMSALILVGIWISPTIAVDGFHSQAGWVAFLVVGLGLIWVTGRMPFFLADSESEAVPPGSPDAAIRAVEESRSHEAGEIFWPSVAACLFPFVSLLAATIVAALFSTHDSIDVLYPVRVAVVGTVLWIFRHEFRWHEASVSPVAVGLGVAVFAVWMLLAPMTVDAAEVARQDPAQLGPIWGEVWLLLRVVGYTMTVPIAEELAFRGFLARRLISVDVERVPPGTFTWLSFLGSSLAFGALHQAAWIPGTVAGMAFAAALYHRRRLGDAIVAHATTNALLTVYVIGTGSWASWG